MKKIPAFVVTLLLFTFSACRSFSLAPGQQMPNFPVLDQEGKTVLLSDTMKGPTLVVFFAAWCEICQEEVPQLNAVHERLKQSGFSVIGVAQDQSQAELKEFIKERNPSYPIYFDNKMLYKKPLKITGFPESILVDSTKKLVLVDDPYGSETLKMIGSRPWTSDAFMKMFLALTTKQPEVATPLPKN